MAKQIAGSVYWIENGEQTNHSVDVREAFSDPIQAKEQIIHAERMGDHAHLKLARLAFRQFQGMRYRGENKPKPKRSTEVDQQRISKPRIKKVTTPVSAKKSVGRKIGRKVAPKVASPSREKPSIAKASKKAVGRKAGKKTSVKKALNEPPKKK